MEHTSMEIINDMAPGWNLGNTFEAIPTWNGAGFLNNKGGLSAETAWQNTRTTQALIDFVKSQGFRSVRIPCAWAYGHISNASAYTIDPQWMARVKEVVDYCLADSLYVILNDHWDGGWLENHIADTDSATLTRNHAILTALWTQIATTFQDYDEHLLFAGLNEPNADTQAATNNLIGYNQTFVNAVRATGGNNSQRVLIVQGPSTNIDYTCRYMANKMPVDVVADRLAVEVHYYNPWPFWGMETDADYSPVFYYWGQGNHLSGSTHNATWGEEADMEAQLQLMHTHFVSKGYPVVIGEFGANWRNISTLSGESQAHHNASIQAHYRQMHQICKDLGGMVTMSWDVNDPSQHGTKGCMTLIDRRTLQVFGTYALQGIQQVHPLPSQTGIENKTADALPANTSLYRLDGQKAEGKKLSPGLYINAGKIILIGR